MEYQVAIDKHRPLFVTLVAVIPSLCELLNTGRAELGRVGSGGRMVECRTVN